MLPFCARSHFDHPSVNTTNQSLKLEESSSLNHLDAIQRCECPILTTCQNVVDIEGRSDSASKILSLSLHPTPQPLADILLVLVLSPGQVDLPFDEIGCHHRVPTPSKLCSIAPSGVSLRGNFFALTRLWSFFLAVDADHSGSISLAELRE